MSVRGRSRELAIRGLVAVLVYKWPYITSYLDEQVSMQALRLKDS